MSDTIDIEEMLKKIMGRNALPDIEQDDVRDFTRNLSRLLRKEVKASPYNIDFVTVISVKGGDGRALSVITTLEPDEQIKLLANAMEVQGDPELHDAETMRD